jgi:hypothetical protein
MKYHESSRRSGIRRREEIRERARAECLSQIVTRQSTQGKHMPGRRMRVRPLAMLLSLLIRDGKD